MGGVFLAETTEAMLSRIDERTELMLQKINMQCEQLHDHECRIGSLEAFKISVAAVLGVLSFAVASIIALYGIL
jgi:hypothetical protein